MKRSGLKIPIVVKLVGVTVGLLLVASGFIAFKSSNLFLEISGPREKDANGVAAEAKAEQINILFEKYVEKAKIVGTQLLNKYPNPAERRKALELSFYQDKDLISVEVIALRQGKQVKLDGIVKSEFFESFDLTKDYLEQVRVARPFPMTSLFSGNIEIRNSSLQQGHHF